MAGITRFEEIEAWKTSRQISRFMNYLETHPRDPRFGEDTAEYNTDV